MKIKNTLLKICSSLIINLCFFNIFTPFVFAADTNYTYTNQEQDKSGLMHYDSRYYDPELGRFLQPDSVDVPNKYAYVSNNPVNRIDPTGHWENFTNSDLFGGNRIPSWQMDNAYQSPDIILSINNRATYYGNFESIDGINLNKNVPFSLDNMQTNMSVFEDTKPQTLYVDAVIEVLGLREDAGMIPIIGGRKIAILPKLLSLGERTPAQTLLQYQALIRDFRISHFELLRDEPVKRVGSTARLTRELSAKDGTKYIDTSGVVEVPINEINIWWKDIDNLYKGMDEVLYSFRKDGFILDDVNKRPLYLYNSTNGIYILDGRHRLTGLVVNGADTTAPARFLKELPFQIPTR